MEFIEKLLTIYFNQIVILLGGSGVFVNHWLNIRSKNIEIRSTLFNQNKTHAINRFIESYVEINHMWNQIPYYRLFGEDYDNKPKLTPNEVDAMTVPIRNKFQTSYHLLSIYLSEKELVSYKNIYDSLAEVNDKFYFLMHNKSRTGSKADEYALALMDCREKCASSIQEISGIYQKQFNKQ